jgi:hypothetical protein
MALISALRFVAYRHLSEPGFDGPVEIRRSEVFSVGQTGPVA